jgi:hypothetical protein
MSNYPGSIDISVRLPAGGQDKRTAAQYTTDLARETEWSLRRSPSWRAGKPLADGERWPNLTSADLGGRGDRPDKGRWA